MDEAFRVRANQIRSMDESDALATVISEAFLNLRLIAVRSWSRKSQNVLFDEVYKKLDHNGVRSALEFFPQIMSTRKFLKLAACDAHDKPMKRQFLKYYLGWVHRYDWWSDDEKAYAKEIQDSLKD